MKVSLEVIWLRGDRSTQALPGRLQPVCPLQHRPEIVVRDGKPGIELGGFAQARDRFVETPEAGQRDPEIVVRLLGRGVEPDRLVEDLDGLPMIATLDRDDPEQV